MFVIPIGRHCRRYFCIALWCSSPKSENGLGGEVPSVGILGKERLDGEVKSGGNQTGGVL